MEPTEFDLAKAKAVAELMKRQSPEEKEKTLNFIIQRHMEMVAAKHGIELSMMTPEWLERTKETVRKALIEVLELGRQ
jgi:hypothetical protein